MAPWLDEPFSTLDAALRADIRRFVFEHAKRLGLATLMETHDAADANVAGDPVVVLNDALRSTYMIGKPRPCQHALSKSPA